MLPVNVMLLTLSDAVPVLFTVTGWEAVVKLIGELNESESGETERTGATPVPLSADICGLVKSESVTTKLADSGPVTVGVYFTVMVQFVPAAREVPQVVVREKSPEFAPDRATLEIDTDVDPAFASVNTCPVLVVPLS